MAKVKMLRLGQFIEDPDNVSEATDDEIKRLAGKLRRVPQGLRAMRIAYVTDDPSGKWKVISGNKRLRVLKASYGDDGEVPADWFQDVTQMSEAERHEFRLNANINDGHFNIDKLLAQYGRDELTDAGLEDLLDSINGNEPQGGDEGDEEINPDSNCNYQEQYGVIVMCKDEIEQAATYEKLAGMGYECKVVAT